MDTQIRLSSDKENLHPMNHAFHKQQVSGTPSSSLNLAPKLRESSYSSISDADKDKADEDQALERIKTSEFLLSLGDVMSASISEGTQLENSNNNLSGSTSLPLINISALGNSQSEQDLLNSILSNTAEIEREKTNMETCQAFYEALVDFDLNLTQTTIDVFERRIPEKMLNNPETSPVECLRKQLKEIQKSVFDKIELVQEAGKAEDMFEYIDKLQARVKRIDTLRRKDGEATLESLEWDDELEQLSQESGSPRSVKSNNSNASLESESSEVACQTLDQKQKTDKNEEPINPEKNPTESVEQETLQNSEENNPNSEEADDEDEIENNECNSTRNSCSSGYESRAKTDSNAVEKTREAIILANMSTPNRKKFLRKRGINTSRQLVLESSKSEISRLKIDVSSKILNSSSDASPVKFQPDFDDNLNLDDFSDVKASLIRKGESFRWKRVVSWFILLLVVSLIVSICMVLPLRTETTPKSSFRKSSFYKHSDWFSVSYPNGAPPV
jgi:hypothetical protein